MVWEAGPGGRVNVSLSVPHGAADLLDPGLGLRGPQGGVS